MKPGEYYYNVQVLTMREYQKPQTAHRDQNVGQWKNMARWRKDELMERTRWSVGIFLSDLLKMGENMQFTSNNGNHSISYTFRSAGVVGHSIMLVSFILYKFPLLLGS
jgi:hypothetical protein